MGSLCKSFLGTIFFFPTVLLLYFSISLVNMVKISEVEAIHFYYCDRKLMLHLVSLLAVFSTLMILMRWLIFLPLVNKLTIIQDFMSMITDWSEILTKICCVSWKQIKDLMQDFSSKHIIPHMEQKIRVLNQQVVPSSIFYRISDMKGTL